MSKDQDIRHRFNGRGGSTCVVNARLLGGEGPPVCGMRENDPIHVKRRWEIYAQQWVTVMAEHEDNDTATVQYQDGMKTRVGRWILSITEEL